MRTWKLVGLAAWLALVSGCAGPLARQWATRAERGLEIQAANVAAMTATIEEQGQIVDEQALAALQRAVQAASADGKADAAFWEAFNMRLAQHVATIQSRCDNLRDVRANDAANAAEIRKCLDGMVRAASAWGTKDEVALRLDRIESIVRAAIEKGATK